MRPWRSWERASMASRRSWVRIPSAPPSLYSKGLDRTLTREREPRPTGNRRFKPRLTAVVFKRHTIKAAYCDEEGTGLEGGGRLGNKIAAKAQAIAISS